MIASWIVARRPSLLEACVALAVGLTLAANTPGAAAILTGLGGAVFALGCVRAGQGVSTLTGVPLPIEQRFLVGLVVLAYLLAVPTYVLKTPIAVGAVVFLLVALMPARRSAPEAEAEGDRVWLLACLAAATGFALIWSLESSRRLASFAHDGVFRLWTDFFIHAGAIAEFGDVRTIGRVSAGLADTPNILYHFVSFALPGLAVRLTGLSPLASVGAVWLPLGIFATALGVFALGRSVAGLAGGALSLLLLAAVPDAASYGLRQGFLSFHWLLETAPGSLYGLPCACLSLAVLIAWIRTGSWRALALSTALLAAIFLLRAHFFLWLVGPWAALCVAAWPKLTVRWKTLLIGAGFVAAVLAMLMMARPVIGKMGMIAYSVGFIEPLHLLHSPTAYDSLYPALIAHFKHAGAAIFGVPLAYVGMGEIPLLTFLIGGVLAWRRAKFDTIDVFPFALLVWAGILMLWAPVPFHGDFSDFRQRGFPLVVVTLFCWNARWAVLLLPAIPARGAALAACAGLVVTLVFVGSWKAPRMDWGKSFVSYKVSPDIMAASTWLRAHEGPATVFTTAGLDANATLMDDATALMGLTGSAAWLSRPAMDVAAGGQRAAAAQERKRILGEVAQAPSLPDAMRPLRAARVAYYVVTGPVGPRWDPMRTAAAFQRPGVAVYDTGLERQPAR